jgi:hypothetical protein
MSPSGAVTITANAGDVVCRSVGWMDVVKFFILNYGLHAFTVVSTPGDSTLPKIVTVLGALLLPFSGVMAAFEVIFRFKFGRLDSLNAAQEAGALCMIVPKGKHPNLYGSNIP